MEIVCLEGHNGLFDLIYELQFLNFFVHTILELN